MCESCRVTTIYNLHDFMHDATIKTQDVHETNEHTQQVVNVTHRYGYKSLGGGGERCLIFAIW